jgi:Ran-binding protein 1
MTDTVETTPAAQEEKAVETPVAATEVKTEEPKKSVTSDNVFAMFGGGGPKPKREEKDDDAKEASGSAGAIGEVRSYCDIFGGGCT